MSKVPLHPIELKVLSSFKGRPRLDFEQLVSDSGLGPDQVRRSLSWLSSKGLVDVIEAGSAKLVRTDEEIPELALVEQLRQRGGSLSLKELKQAFGSDQQFSAAIGRANSSGWVSIASGKDGQMVVLR